MTQEARAPQRSELDGWIEAYENLQAREGKADLADFLPAPDHILYRMALRELVRVDLEYGYRLGRPRALDDYRRRFPELFADPESLEAVAFEEYRLRHQAGEKPTPAEYRDRYGVRSDHWLEHWGDVHDFAATRILTPPAELEVLRAYQQFLLEDADRDVGELESARRHVEEISGLPRAGSEFLGFQLEEELGRGTFGRVYLARQGDLADRYVALKISAELEGESQTLAQLQHPNIVPIYSRHRAPPFHAVCMPFLGATTLADFLKDVDDRKALPASGASLVRLLERGKKRLPSVSDGSGAGEPYTSGSSPLPFSPATGTTADHPVALHMLEGLSYVRAVLWLGSRLAAGLQHAHERGILHRDLKPANILLTDDGRPMLLDFNLSEDTKLRSSVSAAFLGGTLLYMAPEHLEAYQGWAHPLDGRSDLYSLGVILYELLTGRHPFPVHRGPLREVLGRMIGDRYQPPPSLRRWNRAASPAVESMVRHLLEPEPARRYQDAAALQEDLERQLHHQPLRHAPELSQRERLRKWLRRNARLVAPARVGAAALTTLLVLALGLLGREYGRLREQSDREVALKHQELQGKEEEVRKTRFHDEDAGQREVERFRGDLRALELAWFDARRLGTGRLDLGREIARGQVLLERFQAGSPGWDNALAVVRMAPPDRERLRAATGELLLLLAQLTADQPARNSPLPAALRLNALAEKCYPSTAVPRAIWAQRAELTRRQALASITAVAGPSSAYGAILALREPLEQARRLEALAGAAPVQGAADRSLLAMLHVLDEPYPTAQKLTVSCPADGDFWGWFLATRAEAYLKTGDDDRAVADSSEALEIAADRAPLFALRAEARRRLGRFDEAVTDATEALRLDPRLTCAYLSRGQARQAEGKREAALADFNAALRLQPDLAEAYACRGVLHNEGGQYGDALADLGETLRLGRQETDVYLQRGRAYLGQGDGERAVADCDAALDLDPDSAAALAVRAQARLAMQDYDQALADMFEAAKLEGQFIGALDTMREDRRFAGALLRRGRDCNDRGRYEEALAHCTDALRLVPRCAGAYLERARAAWRRGTWERATADCSAVLRLDPCCAEAYWLRGSAYRAERAYDAAGEDYETALSLDPHCERAFRERTLLWLEQNSSAWVRTHLDRLVAASPSNAHVLAERGRVYVALARREPAQTALARAFATRAVADCTKALELRPSCAEAYAVRADARLSLGQLEGAIADATEALRLAPTDEQAYVVRARAYHGRGGAYHEAVADCGAALRLAPRLAEAYRVRGEVNAVLGRMDLARADEQQAGRLSAPTPSQGLPVSTSSRADNSRTTEFPRPR